MRTSGTKRLVRVVSVGVLVASVTLGMGSWATAQSSGAPVTPSLALPVQASDTVTPALAPTATAGPYGEGYPIIQETNFSRPVRALSSDANSDFSQLEDLERLIRGTYLNPNTGQLLPADVRRGNVVYMSMSRMEKSKRVGRTLVAAAKAGVRVVFIHGKAAQSPASRSLQKQLNATKTGTFKICAKGKSLACLSPLSGAIIHTKTLMINRTYTREGAPAQGAVWFGSPNIGGPSGEHTFNNGLTIYNDKKLYSQGARMFKDMYEEKNVGYDYPKYIAKRAGAYGYAGATADGYTSDFAAGGYFYSNLSNFTVYPTPIAATPVNGRDPVMNALNRIIPDETCRIRVQHNRFKYRRIAVANKLAELSNAGCKVSAISYQDDLKANRAAHCQIYIRICQPILDVLRTSTTRVDVAYAKPHDKLLLIEAKMTRSPWNVEELQPNGQLWPAGGVYTKFVQGGSAALTGSNLVMSDEVITESTDPQVFEEYLQHWRAISTSREYKPYAY